MEKARDAMRRHVGYYASTPAYRPVLDLHGWGDLQTELYQCSKQGRWDDMARLVDDEVLDTLTIVCTPDELAGEVGERYGGLVDRINVSWWRKEWWPDVEKELRACDDCGRGRGRGRIVAPGFEPVAEVLGAGTTVVVGERERRAGLGDGGGAFCAFVDGECVVDMWAGEADGDGSAVGEGTRAVIMSSTKGLTTLCAHLLEDRGELDLDAPVVRYWPEFGQAGKEGTHGAPAAQPPVGRHRVAGVRRAAVLGRRGLGRHRRHRRRAWPAVSRPGSPGRGTATTA